MLYGGGMKILKILVKFSFRTCEEMNYWKYYFEEDLIYTGFIEPTREDNKLEIL